MFFRSRSPFARKSLLFSGVITALVVLAFVGCGRTEEPAPSNGNTPLPKDGAKGNGTAPVADGEFKVALVMSGPKSDNGWNAGAAKALDAVKTELKLADDNVKSVDNQ